MILIQSYISFTVTSNLLTLLHQAWEELTLSLSV